MLAVRITGVRLTIYWAPLLARPISKGNLLSVLRLCSSHYACSFYSSMKMLFTHLLEEFYIQDYHTVGHPQRHSLRDNFRDIKKFHTNWSSKKFAGGLLERGNEAG